MGNLFGKGGGGTPPVVDESTPEPMPMGDPSSRGNPICFFDMSIGGTVVRLYM
jgi:hypothetical protein